MSTRPSLFLSPLPPSSAFSPSPHPRHTTYINNNNSYAGVGPNVARATILAAAELSSYDQIKQFILDRGLMSDNVPCHFVTAICAGFIGSFCCNPADLAKSRVMNQARDPATGRGLAYSGMIDCLTKTVSKEGVTALWSGFIPAWLRVGPRVCIIFVYME